MICRAFRTALLVVTAVAASPVLAGAPPVGAASCSGCHRSDGTGSVSALTGSADDIVAAVAAYRSGARPATVMDRLAKGFTDDEIRAIAAWIAAQSKQP
jgi:sulfide dehydrogenase cytochrome subunit